MNDTTLNLTGLFPLDAPDISVSARQTFGIDTDMEVPAFSKGNEYVPIVDDAYQFDHDTTLAILAGFAHNRRVMIQGYHGTGKSTHIEQVAARMNWPCIRVNLDSHISRIDLIGKDAIVIKDGNQVTEFKEGILPWCVVNSVWELGILLGLFTFVSKFKQYRNQLHSNNKILPKQNMF